MPTGLDHVLNTVALCERLTQEVSALPGTADAWKQTTAERLSHVQAALVAMQERFFLRSKLCLPFAARCEQEANKLAALLTAWRSASPQPGGDEAALRSFGGALDVLERGVKVLDERSNAQGMVIT